MADARRPGRLPTTRDALLVLVVLASTSWPVMSRAQESKSTPQQQQLLGIMRTPSGETVPIPDPTQSTLALLNREVSILNEKIEATNKAIREILRSELDSMRMIIDLRDQKVNDAIGARTALLKVIEEENDKRIIALQALFEERFNRVDAGFTNVDNQFTSRDTALSAALTATQTAADNALTATKEAVSTAGIVTKDLINQQGTLLNEVTRGLSTSLGDVKERLTAIEARTAGIGEANTNLGDNIAMFVGIGGFVIAMISITLVLVRKPESQVRYVAATPPLTPGASV